jgi:hypothetical protein
MPSMNSKRSRKRGFALNKEEYIDQIWPFVLRALCEFFDVEIGRANNLQAPVLLWDNELRRLVDLQIPNWIAIAPANGRYSRATAIEEAVGQIQNDSATTRAWTTAGKAVARHLKVDSSTLLLPDQQQLEAVFFSRVRTSCAAALRSPEPRVMSASLQNVFAVWDHVSAALTYHFEAEVATTNKYLTHVVWWEDRFDTYLDRLGDWIERMRRTKLDPTAAVQEGLSLVPVNRIWSFALNEITRQLAIPANELHLPDREVIEKLLFARVRAACAAPSRHRDSWPKEHDDQT